MSGDRPVPAGRAGLGFGCSGLGTEVGYRAGCALVEAAYDSGFRHFDLAPPYGRGQAERIVGDVLASVRSQITLVSKVGIPHPRAGGMLRGMRRLALPLKRLLPGLWKRAAASTAHGAGGFAIGDVQRSLDETLRRLRTDRLDALLLHELQPEALTPELRTWLADVRSQGLARALGTATSVAASTALLLRHGGWIEWVQTNHYWGSFDPLLRAAPRLVTHRALRTGQALLQTAAFQALLRDAANAELTRALADPSRGAELLLHAAMKQADAGGTLLVSTTRRGRLATLQAAAAHDPAPALSEALNRLFAQCRAAVHEPDLLDC